MNPAQTIPVALTRCPGYGDPERLRKSLEDIFTALEFKAARGTRILVKPNLLAPTPPLFLPCTDPAFISAVCALLLDAGAGVKVGDSPSLGRAVEVARKIGLTARLDRLGVEVVNLNRPRFSKTGNCRGAFISREVLGSDLIVSLPKLKTHHMALVTGAVKNLFGCVPGKIKGLSHVLLGAREGRFEDMLLDLPQSLPPCFHLLDGIVAMQGPGPVKGSPYKLGLVAGSFSAVGLDTALYTLLGLNRGDVPLWERAAERRMEGNDPDRLSFPLARLEEFPAPDFRLPLALKTFFFLGPARKVKGRGLS